ncbi:hypothetical protein HZA57_09830, partial [Candidatus Poribacteria bacterium]|nr:hypothetical protein [Candidatus Poribacteria bacterium]
EPLYYSAMGHHLVDIAPIPWGHLLWQDEEFAALAAREAGAGREWIPGEPLSPRHLLRILRDDLNYAEPAELRRGLLGGPWRISGWVDLAAPGDEALAREMGLREALVGIPSEALFLYGLRIKLRRESRAAGLRLPMRLSYRTRRWLHPWRR